MAGSFPFSFIVWDSGGLFGGFLCSRLLRVHCRLMWMSSEHSTLEQQGVRWTSRTTQRKQKCVRSCGAPPLK
eukprot:5440743-Amphidinium_carterae.1